MLTPTRKITDTPKTRDDKIRKNIVSYLHAREMISEREKDLESALLNGFMRDSKSYADAVYYWKSCASDWLKAINCLFEGQEIPELFQLVGKAYAALIVEDGVITHITTTTLIEEMGKDAS